MIKDWYVRAGAHMGGNRYRWILYSVIGLLLLIVIAQFLYPTSKLLPFANIDGKSYSAWTKSDAISNLDTAYKNTKLNIYFSNAAQAYKTPLPADIGLTVANQARLQAADYPWYMRLIPSSLLWAHYIYPVNSPPSYTRNQAVLSSYITKQFGPSCSVQPVNASVKVQGTALSVVPSVNGGTCDTADLTSKLSTVEPHSNEPTNIAISGKEIPAAVSDVVAKTFADSLTAKLSKGVSVTAGSSTVSISPANLYAWLDIAVTDGALGYSFNADRASAYLNANLAPKVAVKAGTTQVATSDFVETSRATGASGASLDVAKTLTNIKAYLDGTSTSAVAATQLTPPNVTYTRSYSATDTGLAALMQNYATSHPGTYGISLTELSGGTRHATYQGDTQFTTASTYKLFVAYSTLLRIESGTWHWSDQIEGGYDLTTCFNRMISLSDNDCGYALLIKIGFQAITNEAHAIGASNTSFLGSDGIKSTASDEALLLAELQTGQILSQQSDRDMWITAMKNNVYRQGIPKGIPGSVIADKVGFLDALLHDAAIVYSPSGTYVLVILTNNASWGNIAELAGQLEALRTQ
jgi:beta-lactamase class A